MKNYFEGRVTQSGRSSSKDVGRAASENKRRGAGKRLADSVVRKDHRILCVQDDGGIYTAVFQEDFIDGARDSGSETIAQGRIGKAGIVEGYRGVIYRVGPINKIWNQGHVGDAPDSWRRAD